MPSAWLIEDDPDAEEIARANLELLGYDVESFINPIRAFLRATSPEATSSEPAPIVDILITDLCVPGRIDGIEGIEVLRKALRFPALPAVVVSAIAARDGRDAERARALGCPFIEKGPLLGARLAGAILEAQDAAPELAAAHAQEVAHEREQRGLGDPTGPRHAGGATEADR